MMYRYNKVNEENVFEVISDEQGGIGPRTHVVRCSCSSELHIKPCLRCFPNATWLELAENSSGHHRATLACAAAQKASA